MTLENVQFNRWIKTTFPYPWYIKWLDNSLTFKETMYIEKYLMFIITSYLNPYRNLLHNLLRNPLRHTF